MATTLNSSPHLPLAGEAVNGGGELGCPIGMGGRQGSGARTKAEAIEPLALRRERRHFGPAERAASVTAAKSTWLVKSCSPGRSRIGAKAWPRTACRVSPGALLAWP